MTRTHTDTVTISV